MRAVVMLQVPLPSAPAAMDGPNWADILEAFSTLIAAIATAATLIFLLRQLRDQQAQTRLQFEQTRKGQAERIVVFMNRDSETEHGVQFSYSVENRSGRPCYFAYFEVFDGTEISYVSFGTLDEKPATGVVELGSKYRRPIEGVTPAGTHTWPFYRVSFMDAANVFWIRDSLGVLMETSSTPSRAWPHSGTFAEKRAQQVITKTGSYSNATPDSISPSDMWIRNGRVARD